MLKKLLISIVFCLILPVCLSFAYFDLGAPIGFVNDYTGTLSAEQKSSLETKLASFEKTTTNEVFVVVINSLQGDSIENFANKLFNTWGIGKKEKNNGALFLVSLDDRKMRIEVGYGLEGVLTDAQTFQMIDKIAKPAFRSSDYFGGIDKVTNSILGTISGDINAIPSDLPVNNSQDNVGPYIAYIFFGLFGLAFSTVLLRTFFLMFWGIAKTKSWYAGGIIGGFIAYVTSSIFNSVIIFLGLILVGLLIDFLASKYLGAWASGLEQKYKHKKKPWWYGGGSGGFGGGGGGGFGGGSGLR
ncbi:MAG: TPM domain-containing protein [bacterium]